jgi:hypothetical protein
VIDWTFLIIMGTIGFFTFLMFLAYSKEVKKPNRVVTINVEEKRDLAMEEETLLLTDPEQVEDLEEEKS